MRWLLALLTIILLASCGTRKPILTSVPEFVVRDRIVPVAVRPDSLWLKLRFECDSNQQVALAEKEIGQTEGLSVNLDYSSGRLNIDAKTNRDTIYISGRDSLIYIPVKGEERLVNYVTTWQSFWIVLGQLGAGWLVITNLPAIIQWLKNKIKL